MQFATICSIEPSSAKTDGPVSETGGSKISGLQMNQAKQ
jgi:hypothetical protein